MDERRKQLDETRTVFWAGTRKDFIEQSPNDSLLHPEMGESNEDWLSKRVYGKRKGHRYAVLREPNDGSKRVIKFYEVKETTEEVIRTETVVTAKPVEI